MIEEEQDAKTDADGVGDFQDSIAGCRLSGDLGVDLFEKGGDVYVVVKCHNGKACAEKGGEADEDDFAPSYNKADSSFFLVGDDEIWFSHVGNIQVWFFGLDIVYEIHNRNHIPSWLVRVCYWEDAFLQCIFTAARPGIFILSSLA